jgi:hypothetical protein
MLQIEGQAPLVAIDRHELPAHAATSKLTGIPPGVTRQRLHLDDVRAPIAEHLSRIRTEQHARQIKNSNSTEWAGRCHHPISLWVERPSGNRSERVHAALYLMRMVDFAIRRSNKLTSGRNSMRAVSSSILLLQTRAAPRMR